MLRPFWRYYGAKWRIAPRYPKPRHRTIIEPFAGAAGYSLRYPDHDVILVEKYRVVAEVWRWLTSTTAEEVLSIPEVDDVDHLPDWVPQGARWLVGFSMNSSSATPKRTLSAGRRKLRAMHRQFEGWTPALRRRVAEQVPSIRHWNVIEGDYTAAPDIEATWFVDPPYFGRPGSHYVYGSHKLNYAELSAWVRTRRGLRVVCESPDATWLPFAPFGRSRGMGTNTSGEAIWWSDSARSQESLRLEAA